MSGYWSKRHSDALLKAQGAENPGLRAIYLQLAAHYLSLQRAAEADAHKSK